MGSSSDWDTMQHAVQILQEFGIAHEARVVSAHRMPDDMFAYAEGARPRPQGHHRRRRGRRPSARHAGGQDHGAGAGRAGGQPHLQGVDSLHSIVQMPKGIPVATFAIGTAGAANAALFAVALLANEDPELRQRSKPSAPPDRGGARHDAATRRPKAHDQRTCDPARRHAGRAGRRPARPHVRACSAAAMGYFTAVLDADPASPAGLVSHHHIQTGYEDPPAWPSWPPVRGGHHRIRERARPPLAHPGRAPPGGARPPARWPWRRTGSRRRRTSCAAACPVRPYAVIETAGRSGGGAADLLPGILKTARMGYDGKGQVRVKTAAELAAAWAAVRLVPCVLEQMLPLALECSVIVARGARRRRWCTCPCSATCTATAFWP
jgi:hypothetical protein